MMRLPVNSVTPPAVSSRKAVSTAAWSLPRSPISRSGLYEKFTNSLAGAYYRNAPIVLPEPCSVTGVGREVMSVPFLLICVASLLFFVVFLVQCSRPRRASRKAPVVLKLSTTEAVDSGAGRRTLIHLEQQMAEFLSIHGRSVAALLLVVGWFGAATQMKAQSTASPASPASAAEQQVPPAVQHQPDAMQKRIEQLE